jgi:hypothetical protein
VKGGKSGPTGRIKAQEARAGSREHRENRLIANCKLKNSKCNM